MTLKEQIQVLVVECGNLCFYGHGKCFMCDCIKSKRGMVVHHRWYLKKGDAIYSDPKYLPHNDTNRLKYLNDLLPLIKRNPKRFMYLCNTHHHALSKARRFGEKLWKKSL